MSAQGVVGTRLVTWVERTRSDYPDARSYTVQRLSWVKPACEEARRLGSPLVTLEHLVLGLLSDPANAACRALLKGGRNLRELRRELEKNSGLVIPVEHMDFSEQSRVALLQATTRWEGRDPDSAYILQAVLETMPLGPGLKEQVDAIIEGSIREDDSLSMHGLRLGMSSAQVLAMKGLPALRESDDCWSYPRAGG